MSAQKRKVPKWLLWICWFRMMFFQMTSQSFDRGYTNSFTGAIAPILKYLYKNDPDANQKIRAGLLRTRNYYLCEQSFSGIAFAIIVGMEEKLANGGPITGEMVSATRSSIIGPMSGLGDTLHGSTTRQLAIALTIPFCLTGNWHAAVAMLIFLNISPFAVAIYGVPRGYQQGSGFVLKLVKSGFIQKSAPIVSSVYMFLMGAWSAKYIAANLLSFNGHTTSNRFILWAAAATMIGVFFWALSRKIKPNLIVLVALIAGIVLSFT